MADVAKSELPSVEAVLVACPNCSAWPMAANVAKPSWGYRPVLQFTCPKCHFVLDASKQREPNPVSVPHR
jgi:predicted RNA-binding Zn-ribbon protein involved in translation (DUF1610 family)